MDKVISTVFEWWNWGVHRLISLSKEYQVGEHAIHYKYAVWITILLCILAFVLFMAFLTLSAMGILSKYSWWLAMTCFKISSLSTFPWFINEWFYQEVRLDYLSLNILYGIAAVWILGMLSLGLCIISKIIQFVIGICCPLPDNVKE